MHLTKSEILSKIRHKCTGWVFDTSKCELIFSYAQNIAISEQEMHCNVDRETNKTEVCVTHQKWITKLRKNPSFHCTEIIYNDGYRILQMRGYFKGDAVTLRRVNRV